jgi:hypothetical protein
MKKVLKKYSLQIKIILSLLAVLVLVATGYFGYTYYQKTTSQILLLQSNKIRIDKTLSEVSSELKVLKDEDQYKVNKDLEGKIKSIEVTYDMAVKVYEKLLDLKALTKNTVKLDEQYADILTMLSKRNYSSAAAELKLLSQNIDSERQKVVASFQIPANVPESNTPPGSGYSSQVVKTEIGEFLVYIVAADLNSTRVIVDTASDSDCRNDCPVLSLGDYVSRSGAFAGINGSYFCPADYPSCADKKNSFDTLAMNKNKTYLNSDNNVYSTVPAVIFSGNSARFVGQSLEWGRDTGVDAVLAMQPLLVSNGNIVFTDDGEPKRGSKGSRSFVGASGSTAYIGVVFNATVAEAAYAIHALGIQNALNLDDGGSTALWSGGYKAGPGRALPNVLLFVGK